MSGGGEGGGGGKLTSVDHGRRTDEGRDKNITVFSICFLYPDLAYLFFSTVKYVGLIKDITESTKISQFMVSLKKRKIKEE